MPSLRLTTANGLLLLVNKVPGILIKSPHYDPSRTRQLPMVRTYELELRNNRVLTCWLVIQL